MYTVDDDSDYGSGSDIEGYSQSARTETTFEYVEGEGANGSNSKNKARREHKRINTWGKKGKKLRDKDPYATPDSFVALSTSRSERGTRGKKGRQMVLSGAAVIATEEAEKKGKSVNRHEGTGISGKITKGHRHDPRSSYGVPITRPTIIPISSTTTANNN